MNDYLSTLTPDSFSGMIFALEGVEHSVVLLNGPTGCKFYHSATSDNQTIKQFEFDPLNYSQKWYFGQPRVPCTYLDDGDYIYGSRDKLTEALEYLCESVPFELLGIVNSPGAALIGDDLEGIALPILDDRPLVALETPGFSSNVCVGYEFAAMELTKKIALNETNKTPEKLPGAVNLLGISIFHKHYAGDLDEITHLFSLCDIDVNCALCANSSLESIRALGAASLNVVIYPEYGLQTAQFMEEQFAIPYYVCDGPPIGFAATEKFITDVCALLNKDASPVITKSEQARALAYAHLSRVNSLTGLPKGVEFALEGTYSELYAYAGFLLHYFGMVLECVSVLNPQSDCFKDRLATLLSDRGFANALNQDILRTESELVFGSGTTIAALKLRHHEFVGIESCLPTIGYIDVIPKTHLGIQGSLLLVEQVLNGLLF